MKTRAAVIMIAAVGLVGCSEFRREVESQPPPQQQRVTVNYKGPDGFKLAVGKADEWCDQHVGASDVRLLKNNKKSGRAIFACEPL
jgi:hypothetical protein